MGFPAVTTEDGTAITGLGPGKPLALLAYLAVRREARREELVDLLWGGVAEANARNAFRQALHRLRTALGEDLVPPDRERVGLTISDSLSIDRQSFLEALERNDIGSAVELYRGDFLEGFDVGERLFDNWVDAERVRLRSMFQLALQKGAEAALATGRWLEALQYVQRLSTVAPFEESAALLEANVLVAAGRGGEALHSLRRFAEALRTQLDVPPSQRIKDLIGRIERSEPRTEATATAARTKAEPGFIGREEEIGRLMAWVRDLAAERGATVLIEGPMGIGKSRLVDELLSRARSTGPLLVLRGRERPFGASLPYASIAEALRGALRAPGISGTGRHLLAEAARILPELRDAFDLPPAAPIDDEGGRLRFFEGVAALLDSAAYEQPICMVFDDMHNASQSTLDLLAYLAARLQTSPVLIVALCRTDADAGASMTRLRALLGDDRAPDDDQRVVRLAPLDHSSIVRLIDDVVANKGVAGQLDVDRLAGAAGGNPLRAVDLARRGLNGEMPDATPTRFRDVLWDRLQKASPSQRRVFFATALIQRRASLRLLAAASHLPEAAAFDAARALEDAELIAQETDGFVIAHDFTATFVSEASGAAGRALLAGWAADALASEPGASNAELAQLYSIAGQQAFAFQHARRAAFEAAAMAAGVEVHRLLNLALVMAPDVRERAEIDSLLAAFGAGRPLLVATSRNADEVLEPPPPPIGSPPGSPMKEPVRPPVEKTATATTRRSFATPRLYWLTAVLVAATILLLWQRSASTRAIGRTLTDSLLVIERGSDRSTTTSVVTGPLSDSGVRLGAMPRLAAPQWLQGIRPPWINPTLSPDGQLAAIERITDTGTDVYLVRLGSNERTPVVIGGGSNIVMGWSPDGGSILVRRARTLADGGFDADLWAYRVGRDHATAPVAVDTSSARSVREAQWSPDGTRIAWVAQTGASHQQDIFVSRSDGTGVHNLTANPADDYHISWSSDGNLLAFTSDRRGNPDLFAFEFDGWPPRLWSLSDSPFPEDFVSFSPDHRYVAFQSTRDADAAVYVMPALGGTTTRVTPRGGQYSIAGWRGRTSSVYVDRFRVIGPTSADVGDSVSLTLLGVDPDGISRLPDTVPVRLLDESIAELSSSPGDSGTSHRFVLHARRPGTARVVASIPGWRYDTLFVRIGSSAESGLSEDFGNGLQGQRWMMLGVPTPSVRRGGDGRAALFPNGGLQWQSGLLSRDAFSLRDGLDLRATMSAPFNDRALRAAQLEIALVADTPDGAVDKTAPQLNEYARIVWDGEASRFTYAIGAESKSDPISTLPVRSEHSVRISIGGGGAVAFYVDDSLRWNSSLKFLGVQSEPRGRVWLGGRATGSVGSIRAVTLQRKR